MRLKSRKQDYTRLEKLRDNAVYAEHMEALMALKWLGNAGSHELDRVSSKDIEDASEIIESVLDKILQDLKSHLAALIDRMTRVFAPKK
jgi:hypothetical protein